MPDCWMNEFTEAGFKPEVQPLILKRNAMRLLGLDDAARGTAAPAPASS
jgi:predicted TIM-barrel fold metal-dependent hydrolase